MNPKERDWFDEHLEAVLAKLPHAVLDILEEVQLAVEDHPSPELMKEMGLTEIDELCGLYDGIPITEPGERRQRLTTDNILIFREGILSEAADDDGNVDEEELRRQIRITIMHEVAHHHGIDEEELRELGYD